MLLEVVHIAEQAGHATRTKSSAGKVTGDGTRLPLHKDEAYLRQLKMDFIAMHNEKILTKKAKEKAAATLKAI
ncbi:hypothetical protein B0I27_10780 [Arcticibacter pallidicorallinus]|uniref:Uncharacterized protein n=1 Tax=Arcticibacter pallidicorallinus TaxID=1259464 RepID=A0A2T0U0R4_9SPHI|nr:hypothetical protein [Arcticibacter pallidicorallinus]PRY51495.1 hypothetical protein B0I27_10780 [Arcticibacter pallidicorallinus]